MSDALRSDAAARDLDEAWDYLAARNAQAAERFLDGVDETAFKLAAQPGLGAPRDDLAPELRMMGVKGFPHVIFYRPIPTGILIVRVIHGSRDVAAVFQDEDPNDAH